jgi:hypothetical protein
MKQVIYGILVLGLVFVGGGCRKNNAEPEDAFIKVYDDANGNKHFHPLGIATSESGDGYITVSAFDGWRIQIMKINNAGEFQWNYELPSNYVNAVPNIIKKNGQNYIVCMDAVGLFTYVLKIDEATQTTTEVSNFPDVLYPTYIYNSGQHIYLQNYDRMSFETGIHELSGDLTSIQNSGSVNIFTDVEEQIVEHVTYTGNRVPFFISTTQNQNYIVMNGYYNYSFSMIFLNPDLSFAGVYNGEGFNTGASAISPLNGNNFALARFSYDNLYFNPNAALTPTTIDIVSSIPAQGQSELDAKKPVLIKDLTISGTTYKAYLSSTRSNQLLISLYETSGGTLVGKKYLGKNIPVTASDFIQTEDGGLNILVQAKIMGSIDRIALMKLSKEQLEAIVE